MADMYDGLQLAPQAPPRPPAPPSMYDGLQEVTPTTAAVREPQSLLEYAQSGWQGSALGLAWRRKLPDLVMNPENARWWERAATGFAAVGADLPFMIGGTFAGAPAGTAAGGAIAGPPGAVVGGILGAGAGMFAVPGAIRESLIQAYSSGDVMTPADWWNAVRAVAATTVKEAGIGAVTFGAGATAARVAGKALVPAIGTKVTVGTATKTIGTADVAAQILAMTTMPAALEGRLPQAIEIMDAAIVIGGLKAAHVTAARIANVYMRTGKTPAEQVAEAKANPEIAADLTRPPDPDVPREADGRVRMPTIQETLFRDQARLTELEEKASGTTTRTVTDDFGNLLTIEGRPAEYLTDAERAERQALRARIAELESRVAAGEPRGAPAEAAPEAAVTPQDASKAKGMAEARLAELEAKAATQALQDAERAERIFIRNNLERPEALVRHFGIAAEAPVRITLEAREASAQRVYDDVLQQVRAADQARKDAGLQPLGDEHALAVAALVRARVRTRAERLGMLAEDVYRERPLQVQDAAAAELARVEAEVPPEAPRYELPEVDLFGMPIAAPVVPRLAVEGLATVEVPLANLVLSKEVPQFKAQANLEGVVVPLGGRFDRTGVGPIQVWERLDGRMEVISGRHRLDLARRSGEETIPAQIHREAEGFDVRQAATLDAQLNIREEQGSVADYAQYFKDSGLPKETADELGLLARAKGRTGFAIARDGSSDLLASHRAGLLSDEAALSISAAAPGSERLQALGIAMVQEGKSILIAVNTMKAVELMAAERLGKGEQGDIFGFDDSAMREAAAMAKAASSRQRKIGEQIAAVSGASKRPELAKKMGVNVEDPEAVRAKIVELRQEQELWDNWPLHTELVAQLRSLIKTPAVTGREGELKQGPVRAEQAKDWTDAPTDEAAYVTDDAIYKLEARPYVAPNGLVTANSRNVPNPETFPPVGTWRISTLRGMYGREIEQLVELPVASLRPTELDAKGRLDPTKAGDDARYAEWLKEGKRPPPINVVQTDAGQLNVTDGHRRLLAAHLAGAKTIEAWVNYAVPIPSGWRMDGDPTKPFIRTGMTYEMLTGEVQNKFLDRMPFSLAFELKPETPAELAARNLEAEAQAKRKMAAEDAAERAAKGLPPRVDQMDLFNTQGTLFQGPKLSDLEYFIRYYSQMTWENETAAREHMKRRIQENNDRYAGFFAPTDTGIVDQMRFKRAAGGRVRLVAPAEPRRQVAWPEEKPDEGNGPNVDWTARDNLDKGTPESIKKAWANATGRKDANLYRAWVPEGDLPAARGEDIKDGTLMDTSGARDELGFRGRQAPPPIKVRIGPRGKIEVLDGNHRLAYWRERDYDTIPAWVLDERPVSQLPPSTLYQDMPRGPTWYSELERQIEALPEARVPAEGLTAEKWKALLVEPESKRTVAIRDEKNRPTGKTKEIVTPAKAGLKDVRLDEIKWSGIEEYLDLRQADGQKVTREEVLDYLRQKALQGMPLFQRTEERTPRGKYQIAENLITILQRGDKSTVIHELSHSWLEEMKIDAERPNAPAQIKADWEILRREFAIGSEGPISEASHETLAGTFERYMGEGRAPSIELRAIFDRFKQWILEIYQALTNIPRALERIDPELRDVFDRWLATDQEIADARALDVPRAYVPEAKAEIAAKVVTPPGEKKPPEPGFVDEQLSMQPFAEELQAGPGSGVTRDSRVNAAFINGPMDLKLAIQQVANIDQANIQARRGGKEGVKSWEQANAEADKLIEDTLGGKVVMETEGQIPHDVKQRAAFKVMIAVAKYSLKLRDEILQKGDNATIQDQFDYLQSIVRMRMAHAEFLGLRAAAARAMNQIRDMTPESGVVDKMVEITSTRTGAESPMELFQAAVRTAAEEAAALKLKLQQIMAQHFGGKSALDIAKLHADVKDLKAQLTFAKGVTEATKWDMVVEGWKASLLSGPVTHSTNFFGTGAFQALRAPVDALAAIIGMARGASPGMGESDRASMSESIARITGMLAGIKDGAKAAAAYYKADEATMKTESYREAIPGRVGPIVRIPLRLMGAEDAFVKTMYRQGELYTLAIRKAFDEGLNPSTREFAERVTQLKDAPTEDMAAIADQAATRMTFNAPLGEKGVALQLFVAKWHLEWVMPFIRTPINITKEVGRMSPFAPMVGEWRADILQGGAARDRAIAEAVLGTGVMALTMAYAFSGDMTGGGGPDPGKSRAKAGVEQPYSIKIGDKWYEYARIQPTGTLMGMAADIATVWDHMTDEERDKIPKLLARAFSNAVTNQTFLQGITNVVNAMSDPARFAPKFIQQMAGSVVPNIIGQPTSMADPTVREVNSALEAVLARIPGFRQDLLPRRDWLGETVQTKERLGLIGPVRIQPISEDKVRLEAARLGISVAAAPKKTHIGKGTGKLGDVELTPEERDTFERVGGEMTHKILTNIVNAPGYEQIPDLVKRSIFSKVMRAAHQVAATVALPPDKRQAYLQTITEKVQAELTGATP